MNDYKIKTMIATILLLNAMLFGYAFLDNSTFALQGQYWQLLTYAFCSANLFHLIINSIALYSITRIIEPAIGARPLLTIFIFSAVFGGVFGALNHTPTVGASAAIFGLYAFAYAHILYHGKIHYPISLLAFIAINLLLPHTNIYAHIGGAVAGIICFFITLKI